jgi:ABC-type polysaccharide/polyol phosphate export permease
VYRDVEHLLLTVFLPWFFLTPVFYNFDQLPGLEDRSWLTSVLYWGNFVSPFVRTIRDPLFFGLWPRLIDVVYCVVVGAVVLLIGALVARRMDDQVAATI